MVFGGCGASGEDRGAGGIRERPRACNVPPGVYAQAAARSTAAGYAASDEIGAQLFAKARERRVLPLSMTDDLDVAVARAGEARAVRALRGGRRRDEPHDVSETVRLE